MTLVTSAHKRNRYSPAEERINVLSHALGLVLSISGLFVLCFRASDALELVSVAVFALSLIALYGSSTIYHSTTDLAFRARMRTVDHAMIYVLIAGTYTPFSLLILQGKTGWTIFAISWSMAAIGILLKLFYTGQYDKISTAMYVFMGWVIVFAIKPLIANFSGEGLLWLLAGGVSYTVGALSYSISKLPFGHAIFHIFVLIGSACHFITVYFFVLTPGSS